MQWVSSNPRLLILFESPARDIISLEFCGARGEFRMSLIIFFKKNVSNFYVKIALSSFFNNVVSNKI